MKRQQSNQQQAKISVTLLNGESHKQGLMMSSEKRKGKKRKKIGEIQNGQGLLQGQKQTV